MAYAILDRTRLRDAFRNTVIPYSGPSGRGRLYHFSIAREALEQSPPPFTEGSVYLLSRDGFSRLSDASSSCATPSCARRARSRSSRTATR